MASANLNAARNNGCTPLGVAIVSGKAEAVKILCILGSARFGKVARMWAYSDGVTAVELAQSVGHQNIVRFLERTEGFVNPLQYSQELTEAEAIAWLRSEYLRNFPRIVD